MSIWVELVCGACAEAGCGRHIRTSITAAGIKIMRNRASRAGWTTGPDPHASGWTEDYCPACSAAPTSVLTPNRTEEP